jgi:hypothetical protein
MDLSGAKKFRVGTSGFDRNLGSLTPGVDVVDLVAELSASSEVYAFAFFAHGITRRTEVQ